MEIEPREGQSVFLRGWGEYQPYWLKLTEAERSGIGHMALRASSAEALERRVAAIEATGRGIGWNDGDPATARPTGSPTPTATSSRCSTRAERYAPPEHLRPALRNQPQRYTAAARRSSGSTTSTCWPATSPPAARFATDVLGYRHYEGIVLDDGARDRRLDEPHDRRPRADLRRGRARRPAAACTTSRSGSTRARSACARPTSSSSRRAHRGGAVQATRSPQGFFLYVFEPGGNRIEVTTGGYFVYDPDPEPVIWTEAERARGQAWGVKTVESFHYYGTPPAGEEDRRYAREAGVAGGRAQSRPSSSAAIDSTTTDARYG